MAYASNQMKFLAKLLGYEMQESVRYGTRFRKEHRRIWSTAEGNWQTADLVDKHYTNHQIYVGLGDALIRPL